MNIYEQNFQISHQIYLGGTNVVPAYIREGHSIIKKIMSSNEVLETA